jgi:beta-glucosidase
MQARCLSAIALALAGTVGTAQDSTRVEALLRRMTLAEKIDYIGGTGMAIRAMPALGLPAFQMSDGPSGVRSEERFPAFTYPAGIGLAATWNRDLARRVGEAIGQDARARGIHFMLGPGANLYRNPRCGRNFEYFGEDPFLAAQTAVGYIQGMQAQGVSATIKHYLANNSEFDRHNTDAVVDERTLRELYLPAFEAAVKTGGVGAVMDSYNRLGGVHLTQNGWANRDVLRRDWGFRGVLMSDWGATYDGVAAANEGLDLEMPTGEFMNRKNLLPAVRDGRVKEAALDEKIRRILATAERFGWLDRPQADPARSTFDPAHQRLALEGARESIVLLRNEGLLPLDPAKTRRVLVTGPDAWPAQPVAGGSGASISFSAVSILEGVAQAAGPGVTVLYQPGIPSFADLVQATTFETAAKDGKPGLLEEDFANDALRGAPSATRTTAPSLDLKGSGDSGPDTWKPKHRSRRFRGWYRAQAGGTFEVAFQGSGENTGYRVRIDGRTVLDDWRPNRALEDHTRVELAPGPHEVVVEDFQTGPFAGRVRLAIADASGLVPRETLEAAAGADAVIVAAGFDQDRECEGGDRTFGLPIGQDRLIQEVARRNPNVAVALTAGGAVDMAPWLDKVKGVLALWYPGEQGGAALGDLVFGRAVPCGKLPVSFERRAEDNPSWASYYPVPATANPVAYREGVFSGYRGYDAKGIEPLFPFGFGLSYTTFRYANLSVRRTGETTWEAAFDLTNTGALPGKEVAQVYVSDGHAPVPRPPRELKGFAKIALEPGETRHVTVPLDLRSLAWFDVKAGRFEATAGTFTVRVGGSSRAADLAAPLVLDQTLTAKP